MGDGPGARRSFVLQTLGEAFLDADHAAHPGTVGYVPAVTARQVWSWLAAAGPWLSRARQARSAHGYDVADHAAGCPGSVSSSASARAGSAFVTCESSPPGPSSSTPPPEPEPELISHRSSTTGPPAAGRSGAAPGRAAGSAGLGLISSTG